MRSVPKYLVTVLLFALACSLAWASDPNSSKTCVAINNPTSAVFVNGKFCKDPKVVTANDFFPRFHILGNTANQLRSNVTLVNVYKLLGLHTPGISLARIDFAPYGLNPPHTHPRGIDIIVVAEGTLYVGFVTSNTNSKLFTKFLNKGDVFVFPIGLIHFQFKVEETNAVAIGSFLRSE